MSLLASLLLLLLSTVSLLSAAGPDQNGGRQAASGGVLEVASEEALDRMVETWGGIVVANKMANSPKDQPNTSHLTCERRSVAREMMAHLARHVIARERADQKKIISFSSRPP